MNVTSVALSSFLASIGFGVLFNIKGNKLVLAGISGAIGGLVYEYGLYLQIGELYSLFFASCAFTLFSEVMSRVCKTPVTTFVVCALIPLVPGGGMYRCMLAAIKGNVDQALGIGLNTLLQAGVLALGIMLVSSIVRAMYHFNRQ